MASCATDAADASRGNDLLRWLRRAAGAAWVAWLASYALAAYQLFARVMHPHFLPFVSLILLGSVAAIVALGVGFWRMIRGPDRVAAIGWVCFAAIPVLAWLTHASYAVSTLRTRIRPLDYRLKLAGAGAAAAADGLGRLFYPNRLAGEHCVMIYDQCADPEGDVAAMDRHIEQVGKVLGRPLPTTVHWIRGELLGIPGLSFAGTAICGGEPSAEHARGSLGYIDRHEAAHNVLNDQLPATARPPTVFNEGWAESQSAVFPTARIQYLLAARRRETALSVRQLLSPEWYANGESPVYFQGGLLVDFLVRRYGGEKFFQLCATCRPETIADDCQDVYGVDLDQLDGLFWADLRDRAFPKGKPRRQSISAELGLSLDGVDNESARKEFLRRYPTEVERLKEAYRHVRILATYEYARPDSAAGRPPLRVWELVRDGDRARLRAEYDQSTMIFVATPQRSFSLAKSLPEARFTTRWTDEPPRARCAATLAEIQVRFPGTAAAYDLDSTGLGERMKSDGFTVTRVVEVREPSRRLLKVYFEYEVPGDDKPYLEAGWIVLRPDECWAIEAYELRSKGLTAEDRFSGMLPEILSELAAGSIRQGTIRYRGGPKGIPVLESVERKYIGHGKPADISTVRVTDLRFGPAPDETFDLASFDADPPVDRGTVAAQDFFVRLTRWLLRAIWFCAAVVMLAVARHLVQRCPRRHDFEKHADGL